MRSLDRVKPGDPIPAVDWNAFVDFYNLIQGGTSGNGLTTNINSGGISYSVDPKQPSAPWEEVFTGYNTVDQLAIGVWPVVVNISTAQLDVMGGFTAANNSYIVAIDGIYTVKGSLQYKNINGNGKLNVGFTNNALVWYRNVDTINGMTSGEYSMTFAIDLEFVAGDELRLVGGTDAGAGLTAEIDATVYPGTWLSVAFKATDTT